MSYLVAGDNWFKPTHFTRSVTRDQLFQHVRDKCIAAGAREPWGGDKVADLVALLNQVDPLPGDPWRVGSASSMRRAKAAGAVEIVLAEVDPMTKRSEDLVKKDVKALLRKHGAYFYMPVPSGFGKRGAPDFYICHRGRFCVVETKRDKITKPSPFQEQHIDAVRDAGGTAFVINATNQHELAAWLESSE